MNAKSSTGTTALMIAATHNNPPMIGLLIESGADIDAKNSQCKTAQDVAELNGNMEAAQAIRVRIVGPSFHSDKLYSMQQLNPVLGR